MPCEQKVGFDICDLNSLDTLQRGSVSDKVTNIINSIINFLNCQNTEALSEQELLISEINRSSLDCDKFKFRISLIIRTQSRLRQLEISGDDIFCDLSSSFTYLNGGGASGRPFTYAINASGCVDTEDTFAKTVTLRATYQDGSVETQSFDTSDPNFEVLNECCEDAGVGACCLNSSTRTQRIGCFQLQQEQCNALGGTFNGVGSLCNAITCCCSNSFNTFTVNDSSSGVNNPTFLESNRVNINDRMKSFDLTALQGCFEDPFFDCGGSICVTYRVACTVLDNGQEEHTGTVSVLCNIDGITDLFLDTHSDTVITNCNASSVTFRHEFVNDLTNEVLCNFAVRVS
jgi:hypothetical protein